MQTETKADCKEGRFHIYVYIYHGGTCILNNTDTDTQTDTMMFISQSLATEENICHNRDGSLGRDLGSEKESLYPHLLSASITAPIIPCFALSLMQIWIILTTFLYIYLPSLSLQLYSVHSRVV